MADKPVCKIPDCDKPVRNGRGWCIGHYQRWRRHGDPLGGKTFEGEPERFLRETAIPYTGDDCLIWPYSKGGGRRGKGVGYGSIVLNRKSHLVHRVVCEEVNGPPPTPDHYAAHSCGKGHEGCVNPRHLRWATPSENQEDRVEHDTHTRGERAYNAKLTEEDVLHIRSLRGKMYQRQIAEIFGIDQTAVSLIQRRKNWAWLD